MAIHNNEYSSINTLFFLLFILVFLFIFLLQNIATLFNTYSIPIKSIDFQ